MTTANNSTRQNLGGQSSGDIDMGSTPGFKSKHPVIHALVDKFGKVASLKRKSSLGSSPGKGTKLALFV